MPWQRSTLPGGVDAAPGAAALGRGCRPSNSRLGADGVRARLRRTRASSRALAEGTTGWGGRRGPWRCCARAGLAGNAAP
eukprot:4538024-Pyramimonas_sp.AAC.1